MLKGTTTSTSSKMATQTSELMLVGRIESLRERKPSLNPGLLSSTSTSRNGTSKSLADMTHRRRPTRQIATDLIYILQIKSCILICLEPPSRAQKVL